MVRLLFSSLRRRAGSVLGTWLTAFLAAVLVSACGVLLDTGLRGTIPAQRYAGVPVVVTADQNLHWTKVEHGKAKTKSKPLTERAWLPETVGTRLRSIPAARVVADVTFDVAVDGRSAVAHGWGSAAAAHDVLVSGRAPSSSDEVAVRLGGPAAARVAVLSGDGTVSYRVVGTVRGSGGPAVYLDDATAARRSGRPRSVAAYWVFGVPATRVRAALAGSRAVVSTGSARGDVEFPRAAAARTQLVSVAGAIGGTTLVVAVLVLVGTTGQTVRQRRRELALVRAIGATPRQVRRLVVREVLLLAGSAGVLGGSGGIVVARAAGHRLADLGLVPQPLHLALDPLPAAAAVAGTLIAARLAAGAAARAVASLSPAEAVGGSHQEVRVRGTARGVGGLVCALGAAALTVVLRRVHTQPAAVPVTYVTALLWLTAFTVSAPLLVSAAARAVRRPARAAPVTVALAVHSASAAPRRLASVVTPLALLVGMATTILSVPATIDDAARRQAADGVLAPWTVTSSGPGVPPEVTVALRASPSVPAVTEVIPTTVWIGRARQAALGVTTGTLERTVDAHVVSGSIAALAPGTVALSRQAAGGRHVGDPVRLRLGDGTPITLQLVAVYSRNLAFGDALLAAPDLTGHVDDPLPRVDLVAATTQDAVEAAVTAVAGHSDVSVTGRAGPPAAVTGRTRTDRALGRVVAGLIALFAAVAAGTVIVTTTVGRRRELALLRASGATVVQVLRTLRWEGIAGGAAAVAAGTAVASTVLDAFTAGVVGTGRPYTPGTPWIALAATTGALVLGATSSAARTALRGVVGRQRRVARRGSGR